MRQDSCSRRILSAYIRVGNVAGAWTRKSDGAWPVRIFVPDKSELPASMQAMPREDTITGRNR